MYTHTFCTSFSLLLSLSSVTVFNINCLLKIKMLISMSIELGDIALFHHCELSSLNLSPYSQLIFFFKNQTLSWGNFYKDEHV